MTFHRNNPNTLNRIEYNRIEPNRIELTNSTDRYKIPVENPTAWILVHSLLSSPFCLLSLSILLRPVIPCLLSSSLPSIWATLLYPPLRHPTLTYSVQPYPCTAVSMSRLSLFVYLCIYLSPSPSFSLSYSISFSNSRTYYWVEIVGLEMNNLSVRTCKHSYQVSKSVSQLIAVKVPDYVWSTV